VSPIGNHRNSRCGLAGHPWWDAFFFMAMSSRPWPMITRTTETFGEPASRPDDKIARTVQGAGNARPRRPCAYPNAGGAKKIKPRAKAARGYDIHSGKPTGREVAALHRLQALTERYIAEGLTPADARTRTREELRANPHRDCG
jgi:hypothetical protein